MLTSGIRIVTGGALDPHQYPGKTASIITFEPAGLLMK